MSWAYDVNGVRTWVPWIVGEPSVNNVVTWDGTKWAPAPGGGVTSVSGTAPIVSSGGATPAISISAATTGAAGSMSAADKAKLDGLLSTPVGTVLWEWNGTDVSQFAGSAQLDTGTGGSAPTLSVVANASVKGGYVLRFNGNNRSTAEVAWLANATLSTYNYRLEIEVSNEALGGSGTGYAGALMLADVSTGTLYGFGYASYYNNCWGGRIDADSVSTGSTFYNPGGDTHSPSLKVYDIRADMGPGPRFVCYVSRYGSELGVAGIAFTPTTNATAVPAGWTGLTPSRFGLWMRSSPGNWLGYIDITRMRVIQL